MNTYKAWERTYNAAVTGLCSQQPNSQLDPQKHAEGIAFQAKLIADRAVQFHLQVANTINESVQSNLAPQLHNQETKPSPYRSTR